MIMKREIKFRGKRIDNGEWVYGDLLHVKDKTHILFADEESMAIDCLKNYKVSPETVGQYTGLKDKNGKEIYEGDIIGLSYRDGCLIAEVVYNEEETAFCLKLIDRKAIGTRSLGNWLSLGYECAIIGNAHDNPEMVKGGTKMRKIFTMCTSIEEADEIGHFIMSKGYEGVQNDSYRYCREEMEFYLKRNRAVHNRNFVFVGANRDMMIVSYCKKIMKKMGLKYIEKPRVFKELLEENEYVQKINMRGK